MKRITDITHDILINYIQKESIVADFTMGQGYDTCFLAKHVKKVYAFDIQEEALVCTREKLKENASKVQLILDGHEHLDNYIKEKIDAGIFNFGYFPLANHQITTLLETSKIAVEKALHQLNKKGVLLLVLYPGHEEGREESIYFEEYCKELPSKYYATMKLQLVNKKDAPYIIVIEKLKSI